MTKRESLEVLCKVSAAELAGFKALNASAQMAVVDTMGVPLRNPRLSGRDRAIAKARILAYRRVMKRPTSGR
jgi:hypothetical protein